MTRAHVGLGTGFVVFFNTSQGGFHPQLKLVVITKKICNVGGGSIFERQGSILAEWEKMWSKHQIWWLRC